MNTLIRKLLNPAIYQPPVDNITLLETHISWVLLAGAYAYKLKKPVDFGFLDFSTLEQRRFYCHEELRLNRRLAPALYLEVITITGTADNPSFNGSGTAIEYAVKMRRFNDAALFDRMLAENRLEARHIDLLAGTVAAFHAAIDRSSAVDAHGQPENIQAAVLENFSHLYPLLPADIDRTDLDTVRTWSVAQFEALRPLMQARKADGWVRECHGDLHLGNIVFIDDRAVPFDGIEFNENLRWVDVINEIAFTAMDLLANNRPDLAYRLLNRYLAATGDYAGCGLLRYYLVYRGMVRAKIALLSMAQSDTPHKRAAMLEQYRRQMHFALGCIHAEPPLLLLCHGFSGSGKSTLASRLAERLPALHLRSDIERKRLCGLTATADSGSGLRQGIYTPDMTDRTYRHLALRAQEILQAGFSVIVDATFLKSWQRDLLQQCAQAQAVQMVILDVQADAVTLRRRIQQRLGERRDASEANIEVLTQQLRECETLSAQELRMTVSIDGERDTDEDLLADLVRRLNQTRKGFHAD